MLAAIFLPLVQTFAAGGCSKPTFFGLVPWYQYLTLEPVTLKDAAGASTTHCEITNFTVVEPGQASSFLLIALAILDDLIRIAAMVAVGFVIYGGIQYISSQGSPDSTKKAQQTIINALIGLVIALLAVGIVTFIGAKLVP